MHSGALILLWLGGVTLIQFVSPESLLVITLVLALIAAGYCATRSARLLKRIRYLLLAIAVVFASFTPGEALFVNWPELSPSREGVALALEHVGRILSVVFCVSILLQALPTSRLVGGLHALLRPFERVGFPADRVAVRTLLVLDYVNADDAPDWKTWLSDDTESRITTITVAREALGWGEAVVVFALVVLLAIAGWLL
jgi:energy-coupling factor transporter transmembrane protein EcfT